jgi:tRNA threonylcarbamoyladenosine biosynthesis protein TsaB
MRIVALDSSTGWVSLALLEREALGPPRVAGELGFDARGSHAPNLPRALEALLRLAGWDRDDPDGYVVTRGPGSFTGIRVGLGTIRGLALAHDRPCAAVTTLDALTEAHGLEARCRLAAISAGRGEFFGALYEGDSEPPAPIDGPWLDGPERLLAAAGEADAIVIPAHGTAGRLHGLGLGERLTLAGTPRAIAAAAGRLALSLDALSGAGRDDLAPLYLRPPDAELDARER